MLWREWRNFRQLTAAFALLAVVFYAALLPGHLTSQFAAQLFQVGLGEFAGALCRGGVDNQTQPAAPDTSCPICKSLSALAVAIPPAPQIFSPALLGRLLLCEPASRAVVEAAQLAPRNRGPPLPA